jgi:hypothetical protein
METHLYLACRQNKVLVPFGDDVDELNFIRLKEGPLIRFFQRWLLGK